MDLSLSSREDVEHILTEARRLIAKPWAWFKGDFHFIRSVKTKTGDKKVDCYCALGALRQAAGVPVPGRLRNTGNMPGYLAAVSALEDVAGQHVPRWNDSKSTTKKDVLAAFDEAINNVKEKSNG